MTGSTLSWGRKLLTLSIFALGTVAAQAQLSGAIFTTTKTGTTVNGNIYTAATDVYLNGGPQNANGGKQLPAGIYFFQVTTPNGGTLLSTDNADQRLIHVNSSGVFDHQSDINGNAITTAHLRGTVGFNGTPVQLYPFSQTTNNGGEYKAWLIIYRFDGDTATHSSIDTSNPKVVDFSHRWAKTDNFKIKEKTVNPPHSLSGQKFFDLNDNGQKDSGEPGISGIVIEIILNGNTGSPIYVTTDSSGNWSYGTIASGTKYEVCEVLPPNSHYGTGASSKWVQTAPGTMNDSDDDRCYNGTIGSHDVCGLDFGNTQNVCIQGVKFYDTSMDGHKQSGESAISGWPIDAEITAPDGTVTGHKLTTDSNGAFKIPNIAIGSSYSISEDLEAGWQQTGPAGNLYSGQITVGMGPYTYKYNQPNVTDQNFGNIMIAPISGFKFYDANMNHTKDSGELTIPGFTVNLTYTKPGGSPQNTSTVTDSNGKYSFGPFPDGTTYSITETLPSGWKQTTSSPITGTITSTGPYTVGSTISPIDDLNIGNILVAPLRGTKFYDSNMNGQMDSGELPVQGFTINLTGKEPDGTLINTSKQSDASGNFSFGPYPDGTTYSLTETLVGNWLQTSTKTVTGTITSSGPYTVDSQLPDVTGLNFGNIQQDPLRGLKFYDSNHNHMLDPLEPGIQNFKVEIDYTEPNGHTGTDTEYTDANGVWNSILLPDGTHYTVKEIFPPGSWVQTFPASGTYTGVITGGSGPYTVNFTIPTVVGINFGNYVTVVINAKTKGYWHNQNGYATMDDGGTIVPELQMLNALCLVRLDGSAADFDTSNPSSGFQDFSAWITSASNGSNMACQLSAQLAAMELNVEAGFVGGDQMIFAPGAYSANSLGIAKLSDLMAEANASICANPNTTASGPARSHQTALEQAIDNGNNNLNWIGSPIIIVSPY